MNNTDLIKKFYESFANADADGMVNCYDDNIVFSDPVFGELKGNDTKNMWRMLLSRSKDIKITFDKVKADDKSGSANWRAEYVYSQTGRKVINKISAQFEFQNEKIIKHTDRFNLWRWTHHALGWKGYLLGWSPFMKKKIQKQTNQLLKLYTKRNRL